VAPSINTSDETQKEQIRSLNDKEKAVAQKLKAAVKVFKFKDAVAKKGDNARMHCGVIAQEVQSIFQSEGLDADQYGLICYDTWDEERAAGGAIIKEAGSAYGVRYIELLAFIISAF
jgi:hypothetical protein